MATPRTLKGFSLLEMLVAIVVLSVVIGISTLAYSTFIRQWDGHLGRFDEAQAQYQRLEWLAGALHDTLPYLVRDQNGATGVYFLGRDDGLTLVTMSPIFAIGEPALIRVFREPDQDGKWQLVYEEAPFAADLLARTDQRMDFRHRLVIATSLPLPRFRYFGLTDAQTLSMIDDVAAAGRAWSEEYDGMRRRYHPDKIELSLGGEVAVFDVPVRIDAVIQAYLGDV